MGFIEACGIGAPCAPSNPPGPPRDEPQPGLSLPPLVSLRLYLFVSVVLGEVTSNSSHFSMKSPTILSFVSRQTATFGHPIS